MPLVSNGDIPAKESKGRSFSRSALLTTVPFFLEVGFKNFEMGTWGLTDEFPDCWELTDVPEKNPS